MSGNQIGGLKARDKNLAKDPEWYKRIGSKGGKAPYTGLKGFAAMPKEKRAEAGRIGGKVSRRSSVK